jgi:hypothetical protein
MQIISCGCISKHFKLEYMQDPTVAQMHEWERILAEKGLLPWTGEFPGDAEAREFGWFSRFVEGSWVKCTENDPDATPDLNRLYGGGANWDADAKRWRLREKSPSVAEPIVVIGPEIINLSDTVWCVSVFGAKKAEAAFEDKEAALRFAVGKSPASAGHFQSMAQLLSKQDDIYVFGSGAGSVTAEKIPRYFVLARGVEITTTTKDSK